MAVSFAGPRLPVTALYYASHFNGAKGSTSTSSTMTSIDKISSAGPSESPETPSLVEEIARLVETQPLMPDLSPIMGDVEYHRALADKIRRHFASFDKVLARLRAQADVSSVLVGEILVSLCEHRGIDTSSPYDPSKYAPNFVLAERLGIPDIFMPKDDTSAPVSHK